MSMAWSADQQRMLSAMGYALYVQSSAIPGAQLQPNVMAVSVLPASAGEPSLLKAADHERLRLALRLAAGGADVSRLVLDIDALRRDPQLKRALWPRLRALRRPH